MKFVVSNEEMKIAEENAVRKGTSFLQLMQNAGTACSQTIEKHADVTGKSFVILCGTGNNGGDGYVICDRLNKAGAKTTVIQVFGEPKSECATHCYWIYEKRLEKLSYDNDEDKAKELLQNAFCIVDCVFGTGFHDQLPERAAELFRFVNESCGGVKVSVDVPSGVNSDTGEIAQDSFHPHITLVLGAMKQGLLNYPCQDFLGEILLLDIGIDNDCYTSYTAEFTDESVMELFPKRNKSQHKGSFGRLLNIGGSMDFSGAAVLSTRAALRTGTGIVTLAAPKEVVRCLTGKLIENTFLSLPQDDEGYCGKGFGEVISPVLDSCTAVSVGCGLGDREITRKMVKFLIRNANCPMIIDADGINSIKDHINLLKDNDNRLILTPHPKEFSRISGKSVAEIQADRIKCAKEFAAEYGVVLLLKGANTVIAAPDGRCWINTTGNPALAKGGSGDVLTGIIGGLLAQGVSPTDAARLGAYIHGLSADILVEKRSMAGILATDIVENLPFTL